MGKVIAAGVVPKLTQQQNVPVFIGKIEFSIHAFGPEHGKTLRCGVILKVIAKSGYLNGRSIAKGQKVPPDGTSAALWQIAFRVRQRVLDAFENFIAFFCV